MTKTRKVRVRYAPSPTGPLHIGGMRTALYNYLFAKKHKGDFILRIEDTDDSRFVKGAEKHILDSLHWCGIVADESAQNNGAHGPYRQSERKHIYKKHIQKLIDSNCAYLAFDSPEELFTTRKKYELLNKEPFQYDQRTRLKMKNSLSLPKEKTQALLKQNTPYVVRVKMPTTKKIVIQDVIRGGIEFNTNVLDDKILLKTDGMPTYHFANVVDDYIMEISHVIRGEEWLPSTPLHVFLYEAFGWKDKIPTFAHLPLILKPSGQGKLSKRDGEKTGYSVFPVKWEDETQSFDGFKEQGFLPQAFLNILALLGWNPGTEQEIFNLQELIANFSLDRVSKGGARFDIKKAKWINQQFIQKQSEKVMIEFLEEEANKRGVYKAKIAKQILPLIKERAETLHDLWTQATVFYKAPKEYDIKAINRKWNENSINYLKELACKLEEATIFNAKTIKLIIEEVVEKNTIHFGAIMNPLRIVLTGGSFGPDLFLIAEILGKKETLFRITKGVKQIN